MESRSPAQEDYFFSGNATRSQRMKLRLAEHLAIFVNSVYLSVS